MPANIATGYRAYKECKSSGHKFVKCFSRNCDCLQPGRVAQSVMRLTEQSEIPGSISGPTTYFDGN